MSTRRYFQLLLSPKSLYITSEHHRHRVTVFQHWSKASQIFLQDLTCIPDFGWQPVIIGQGERWRERRQGKRLIDGGASRRYFSATRYYFIIPRHRSSIIRNHFLAHSLSAARINSNFAVRPRAHASHIKNAFPLYVDRWRIAVSECAIRTVHPNASICYCYSR